MKTYSARHFSIFRIALGAYLFVHFAMLVPFAGDLFSNQGLLPDPALNLTYGYFPNILYIFDSPNFAMGFVAALALLSLFFMAGKWRRIAALLLWYGWAALFNRNNLISNPGLPFIGFLLLLTIFVPLGETLSAKNNNEKDDWSLSPVLFYGTWLLMALGYSLSGLDKALAPSWQDGTALGHVLALPLARDLFLRDFLLGLPPIFLALMTWSVLALEIAFLPLCFWKGTRKFAWVLMVGMHLGIMVLLDFADLSLGMLMVHLFTFDSRWLEGRVFVRIAERLGRVALPPAGGVLSLARKE